MRLQDPAVMAGTGRAGATGARAHVVLARLLQGPGVTSPVVGPIKLEPLEDLVRAVDVKLAAENVVQLEAPYQPKHTSGEDDRSDSVIPGRPRRVTSLASMAGRERGRGGAQKRRSLRLQGPSPTFATGGYGST